MSPLAALPATAVPPASATASAPPAPVDAAFAAGGPSAFAQLLERSAAPSSPSPTPASADTDPSGPASARWRPPAVAERPALRSRPDDEADRPAGDADAALPIAAIDADLVADGGAPSDDEADPPMLAAAPAQVAAAALPDRPDGVGAALAATVASPSAAPHAPADEPADPPAATLAAAAARTPSPRAAAPARPDDGTARDAPPADPPADTPPAAAGMPAVASDAAPPATPGAAGANPMATLALRGDALAPAEPRPAADGGAAPAEAHLPHGPDTPAFAPALGSQLRLWVRQGVQQALLQLSPAELGPVAVQIALDGQRAQVEFVAAHAHTRAALEASLPTLAAALRDSGLTLAGGGVFDQPRGDRGEPKPAASPSRPAATAADAEAAPGVMVARRGVVDLVA